MENQKGKKESKKGEREGNKNGKVEKTVDLLIFFSTQTAS